MHVPRLIPTLVLVAGLTALGACQDGPITSPSDASYQAFGGSASAVTNTVCTTLDFSDFDHGDPVTSLTVQGVSLSLSGVRYPGGESVNPTAYDVELTGSALAGLDNTHDDTQAARDCAQCAGLGTTLVVPDENFAVGGDNTEGGEINFTGFASDPDPTAVWEVTDYSVVDGDSDQGYTKLFVDNTFVTQNTRTGNATVEDVSVPSNTINNEIEFKTGVNENTSGGIDNVRLCRTTTREEAEGRMTGGGIKATGTEGEVVTFGATLHCDITLSNNLEVNWGGHQWHLDKPITKAECSNVQDDAKPPVSPIDTFYGEGYGRLDGVDDSFVTFQFEDHGEPGRNDKVQITIYEPGSMSDVALQVDLQNISVGNWQMHYDQPHGQKP